MRVYYDRDADLNLIKGKKIAIIGDDSGRPPKMWGRGLWKVYLDSEEDIRQAILYVQDNPVKEGKPPQRWSFVHDP